MNRVRLLLSAALAAVSASAAPAAVRIDGHVQAGGAAVANSTVTLWEASAGEPRQLAQAKTDSDGRFEIGAEETPDPNVSLYLVAKGGVAAASHPSGDNPAIALLSVLGGAPPAKVVINEMTTVASVWTNAQFLDGAAIRGHALGLSVAAGNVPNFVDLATGGYGGAIQAPFNSTQTPTMANFATLSTLLAGCSTRVAPDACNKLFAATTTPNGKVPTDTLTAAEAVASNSAFKPERLFALLDAFYRVPNGKTLRATPYTPYLSYAPSAWVLPLRFTGGGLNAPGKISFDSEGNAWTGDNFIVGSQATDGLWDGNLSKIASNGRPLSPMTTGFTGGGVEGPGFGTVVTADGKVWVDSTAGKAISVFGSDPKTIIKPGQFSMEIPGQVSAEINMETEYGVTFTSNGFGGWFRDRCDKADLHACTAHGLRRAGATFAAENGATVSQLMAIFGWATANTKSLRR